MARTLSVRDLLVCEELSHIKNEVALLHPDNDELVASILEKVGFDVAYPWLYVPSKHRCMQNKVEVGFMVVGEIQINREFINSPMCSITERLVASAYIDPSMTRELSSLMGHSINYKALMSDDAEYDGEELPSEMLEPDREHVAQQIKQLTEIRDMIRGSPYNAAGDLRTWEEYRTTADSH